MYLFTYSIYVQVATFMFVEQKGFTFEKVWFKVLNQKFSTWYIFVSFLRKSSQKFNLEFYYKKMITTEQKNIPNSTKS